MLTSTIREKDPSRAWCGTEQKSLRGRKFREVLEEAKRLVRAVSKAEGAAEEGSVAPARTGGNGCACKYGRWDTHVLGFHASSHAGSAGVAEKCPARFDK